MLVNNNNTRLNALFRLYVSNKLAHAEYVEFWQLLNSQPNDSLLTEELKNLWKNNADNDFEMTSAEEWDNKFNYLKQILNEHQPVEEQAKSVSLLFRYRWAAAAIFLIGISLVFFLLNQNKSTENVKSNNVIVKKQETDVMPGGNKAVLILGDGKQIILDSAGNGELAQQGSTSIVKQNDGQLTYNSGNGTTEQVVFNTLSTPVGGQYKLTLPDGSIIWLNAASSLKYPTAFTGHERRVQITGEAYFEVSKDAAKPFVVEVNGMEVQVLGTHFNINSYNDEETVSTTLLEGSVKIKSNNQSQLLKPGQQAQLNQSGNLKVVSGINMDEIVAWKEGNFYFEEADIKTVMRQLARWYNITITYQNETNKHFVGVISRNVTLTKVLDWLQKTGEIKLILNGNNVTVKSK